MKENKYYKPDISEFHYGFEYESKRSYDKNDDVWDKSVWEFDSFLSVYDDGEYAFDNYAGFRVKYLDKSDIESLGFQYVDGNDLVDLYSTITRLGITWISYYSNFNNIKIWFEDRVRDGSGMFNECYVFRGKVKNKNELSKILEMVGVNLPK